MVSLLIVSAVMEYATTAYILLSKIGTEANPLNVLAWAAGSIGLIPTLILKLLITPLYIWGVMTWLKSDRKYLNIMAYFLITGLALVALWNTFMVIKSI